MISLYINSQIPHLSFSSMIIVIKYNTCFLLTCFLKKYLLVISYLLSTRLFKEYQHFLPITQETLIFLLKI
jgi:hypothetical protein